MRKIQLERWLVLVAALALCGGLQADDRDFLREVAAPPNIIFILDTSSSMVGSPETADLRLPIEDCDPEELVIDTDDPPEALEVRWDWQGDGTWDTAWTTDKAASHAYPIAGSFTVALAAGLTVACMTKWRLPVSTSQAIVGGVAGGLGVQLRTRLFCPPAHCP